MKSKLIISIVALFAVSASGNLFADQECKSVRGKIVNNAISPTNTLGIVKMRINDGPKLSCGLIGSQAIFNEQTDIPLGVDGSAPLQFDHTIACNDHSQITLRTWGYFTSVPETCSIPGSLNFSFIEYSVPNPLKLKKGLFADTTGGQLAIVGNIDCAANIDMEFTGEICWSDDELVDPSGSHDSDDHEDNDD